MLIFQERLFTNRGKNIGAGIMENGSFWYQDTINLTNNGQFQKCKDFFPFKCCEHVLPTKRMRLQPLRAWCLQPSTRDQPMSELCHLKYVAFTLPGSPLLSVSLVESSQSPLREMKPSLVRQSLFLFLCKLETLPFLSLAPQSLLAGFFFFFYAIPPKSSRHWGLQQIFSKWFFHFNGQRASQLEIFSFKCLSILLFYLFLFSKCILQLN